MTGPFNFGPVPGAFRAGRLERRRPSGRPADRRPALRRCRRARDRAALERIRPWHHRRRRSEAAELIRPPRPWRVGEQATRTSIRGGAGTGVAKPAAASVGPPVAVELQGATKVFGAGTAHAVRAERRLAQHPRQRVLHAARAFGLRQDDAAAHDRGFEELTAGRILLFGQEIDHLPPNRRPVNTVFQYALFPHMTVAENVAFGLQMLGRVGPRSSAWSARCWSSCACRSSPGAPQQLSGGQQQRGTRPRARDPPQGAAARRAAVRARSEAAPGDAGRAQEPAARDRDHVHLRHPRSGRGAHHERSDRGDVERRGPAGRDARRDLRASRGPLRRRASSARPTCWAPLVERAHGRAVCALGGERLLVEDQAPPGERVTLSLRPEKVALRPAGIPVPCYGTVRGRLISGPTPSIGSISAGAEPACPGAERPGRAAGVRAWRRSGSLAPGAARSSRTDAARSLAPGLAPSERPAMRARRRAGARALLLAQRSRS